MSEEIKAILTPGGFTLRDYFAAAALTGILTHEKPFENPKMAAFWALEQADVMLEARGGGFAQAKEPEARAEAGEGV